jgi:hypothetical protein
MKLMFFLFASFVVFDGSTAQTNTTILSEFQSTLKAFEINILAARDSIVTKLQGKYTRFIDAFMMIRSPLQAFINFFLDSKSALIINNFVDTTIMAFFDVLTFNFQDDRSRSKLIFFLENAQTKYNQSLQEYLGTVANNLKYVQCRNKHS